MILEFCQSVKKKTHHSLNNKKSGSNEIKLTYEKQTQPFSNRKTFELKKKELNEEQEKDLM